MITKLRKRHRIIWLVMAVVLPLLFMAAYMSIPKYQLFEGKLSNTVDDYLITMDRPVIVGDNWLGGELEIDVLRYERSSSALVYLAHIDKDNYMGTAILVGKINNRGKYKFQIKISDFIFSAYKTYVVIYDPIKQREIYEPIQLVP